MAALNRPLLEESQNIMDKALSISITSFDPSPTTSQHVAIIGLRLSRVDTRALSSM